MSVSLPKKFDPYIINSNPQFTELHQKVEKTITTPYISLRGKDYIRLYKELPDWIIKGRRTDELKELEPDTHVYRIRRALKLQSVIERYGFTNVIVPQKLLYCDSNGEYYVIEEKVDLNVDKTKYPKRAGVIRWVRNFAIYLWNGKANQEIPRELITEAQAKELAILCYEGGLMDVGPHNLNFTKEGNKVAILDTEPLDRTVKKRYKRYFQVFPPLKKIFQLCVCETNIENLKLLCETKEGIKVVSEIQLEKFYEYKTYVIQNLALYSLMFSASLFGAVNTSNYLIKVPLMVSTSYALSNIAILIIFGYLVKKLFSVRS